MRHALLLLLAAVVLAGCQLPPAGKHNVALVYGISIYDESSAVGDLNTRNLPYPSNDAQGIADALNRDRGGGFHTTVRTDSEATKHQIGLDFAAAAAELDADSVFLFYYAGHGAQGNIGKPSLEGHAAIFPYGSLTDTTITASNAITDDDLRSLLDSLPTKKVIVIMDACFTAGFIKGVADDGTPQDLESYYIELWKAFLKGEAPESAQELAEWFAATDRQGELDSWETAVANGTGIASSRAQLLMAAGALEQSWDGPEAFQHGAFTYFLLEAKTRGDYDGNGVVTMSEAYRYTFANLQTRWNGLWGAVGQGSFGTTGKGYLPHLATGPNDYVLFR